MHHIREEYNTAAKNSSHIVVPKASFSISNFVLMGQPKKQPTTQKSEQSAGGGVEASDSDTFAQGLKPVLMEAIQDVLDELETVYDNISKAAKDHIHSE